MLFVEDGLVLFLGGQDDTIGGFEADGGGAGSDGGQRVLDLDELARRAEIEDKWYSHGFLSRPRALQAELAVALS